MKLKLLKGLTLALAFTLVGAVVVPVYAANTNGNVIDQEMLDGEMDMDEDCGSLELDAGLAEMDHAFEDSKETLEGFNVEGFTELFSEALTSENDPVNTVYDDYSLQTGSDNDGAITEEVSNQSEMDEMLENMKKVGSYSEDLGDGLVMEVTEYVKEHPSLSRANVNKVEHTFSSNPYDYIQNSEYYDNVVKLGVAALPELENMLKTSENNGLNEYIIAIAIEEISHADVNAILENPDGCGWENAKEFSGEWAKIKAEANVRVEKIIQSNALENKEKAALISDYGVLAVPVMEQYISNNKMERSGNDLKDELTQVMNSYGLSTEEVSMVSDYIEAK